MSIFGRIRDSIFGRKEEPVAKPAAAPAGAPKPAAAAPAAPPPPVDVEAVLLARW
jgi:hypothetical protein